MTMESIAAELGLSRKTVSVVLNGRERQFRLSEATVRRVREHLAQRGYVPSRQARHLRVAPGRVFGILHVDGLYTHLIDAFHQLSGNLSAAVPEVEIMVATADRLENAVRELLARRVTDLVWIHHPEVGEPYRDERVANYLRNMHTVIYDYRFDSASSEKELHDRGVALVGVDRKAHVRRMGLFLKRLGHKVAALPDVAFSFSSYSAALAGAGLVVADCQFPFRVEKLLRAMSQQGVTAAFFNGDTSACQAIAALEKRGVRIPEDLTVIGFDGTSLPFCRNLTTLAMPVGEMAARTCEIVTGKEDGLRHCFDMELIKGKTHGLPRS